MNDSLTDPAAAPGTDLHVRRAVAAETTLGRCGNLDYCSIGQHRELVRVPLGAPFICPECAKPLRPPGPTGLQRPVVLPALRLLVLAAGIGAGAAMGYVAGTAHRARQTQIPLPAIAALAPPEKIAAGPSPAAASPGPKTAPPGAPAGHAPALHAPAGHAPAGHAPATPGPANAAPFDRILARLGGMAREAPAAVDSLVPVTTKVVERPFPPHPPPLDRADPPPVLQSEHHVGEITVDCVFADGAVHPVCRASSIRGADAFSGAATTWLQDLAPQYTSGADHRWRVVIEDYTGLARPRR